LSVRGLAVLADEVAELVVDELDVPYKAPKPCCNRSGVVEVEFAEFNP